MEKDITNEEYERIKAHIKDYSFIDLVIWRNQMIDKSRVNNRLYYLIDGEIRKRNHKYDVEDNKEKISK